MSVTAGKRARIRFRSPSNFAARCPHSQGPTATRAARIVASSENRAALSEVMAPRGGRVPIPWHTARAAAGAAPTTTATRTRAGRHATRRRTSRSYHRMPPLSHMAGWIESREPKSARTAPGECCKQREKPRAGVARRGRRARRAASRAQQGSSVRCTTSSRLGTRYPCRRAAQCRQEVLEADRLGDEEECALRDHLLAVHPKTVQPETRSVLLRQLRRDGGAAAGWRLTLAGALRLKAD